MPGGTRPPHAAAPGSGLVSGTQPNRLFRPEAILGNVKLLLKTHT